MVGSILREEFESLPLAKVQVTIKGDLPEIWNFAP
jgi:hypothetical protein